MFKGLLRVSILIIVVFLTGLTIYRLGQRQAMASPSPFPEGRAVFARPEGRPPFERLEGREGFGEREERFSLTRGLSGLIGRFVMVAIIVAVVIGLGRLMRLALVSAPLPQSNGIVVHRDEG